MKLIKDVINYDSLTNEELRAFLDKRFTVSRTAVILEELYSAVKQRLRTDMSNLDEVSHIEYLFTNHDTLPCCNGVERLPSGTRKALFNRPFQGCALCTSFPA